VFEIGDCQWNGKSIGTCLAGDLAENQIVAGKVGHHERGTAFAGLKIRLRKRKNDHFAG